MSAPGITYSASDGIEPAEYIDFLRRSGLISEYPRKAFEKRVAALLENVDVRVTARAGENLVGVCLGLTDFVYFLYLTDLAVDRDFGGRGIGSTLVRMAHEAAGGEADITMITWGNSGVAPFYESCGMSRVEWAMGKHATEWDLFTVE